MFNYILTTITIIPNPLIMLSYFAVFLTAVDHSSIMVDLIDKVKYHLIPQGLIYAFHYFYKNINMVK